MKKLFIFTLLILFCSFIYSQTSISDVIKSFDEDLMKEQSTRADVTIGFITYAESNTCGTIVPFLQKEIKNAADNTRRINIVKTTDLTEYEQAGIATRGLNMGMSIKAKTVTEKKYVIDGKYYDKGNNVELVLLMRDSDGNVFSQKTALIAKDFIEEKKLNLFPANNSISEEIQKDFEKVEIEQEKNEKKKISLAASMLDSNGGLVNILYPNDIVKFKISADTDCYIAILCIDANGIKNWLPTKNNFLEADSPRLFPDISGAVLRVSDDGVYGAEQVVIYASTNETGLPNQNDNGKYNNQDLHLIMKKQQNAKQNKNYQTGTFKITYTIMEK